MTKMETFADIFKRVYSKPDVTLSTGAVVKHRPMLSGGLPNGATDAYLIDNRPMTYAEFLEYNELTKGKQ
jgi:hypothetical protein